MLMRSRWAWLPFFALIAFAFAGTRPLGEPDEGRYAEAAREMLVTGDWLVPRLQGQPHLTKPPMTYWLMATGMRLAGVNEWGARLPVALAFFLTILCIMELARVWGLGEAAARAAGLVFATSALPFIAGHLATTDMILTCWETFGVLALWKVWRGSPWAALWRWGFWLAFAGAFVTKGPPGWLPLLAVLIIHLAAKGRSRSSRLFSIPAFLAFLAASLAWFFAIIHHDAGMLNYFLGNEVVGRVFTNVHHRDKGWWFYPVVVMIGLTPWIFLLPALVRHTLIDIKPELAERGAFPSFIKLRASVHHHWQMSHARGEVHFLTFLWIMLSDSVSFAVFKLYHFWRRLRRCEDIKFFSFLWFFVPLAVFAVAKSKMYFYIVPLFVPLAVWSGYLLSRWRPSLIPPAPAVRRRVCLVAALWLVVAMGFTVMPEIPGRTPFKRRLAASLVKFSQRTGATTLYTTDNPIHSISFYSGLRMLQVDENAEDILSYLRKHPPATGPALLLIKKSRIRKLHGGGYTIAAEDKEMAVLQVEPKPAKKTDVPR